MEEWTAHSPQSGHALVFVLLALALVFFAAAAFSVDMSNLWFHRQTAQNAADSSCVAGAMDLMVDAQSGATGHQGFTNGTAFTYSAGSTAAPCRYAGRNGYNSSGGNLVSVSFPTSVAGQHKFGLQYNSKLGGNSGSGTIVGSIIVDRLTLQGTSGITMDLNATE